MNDTSNRSAPSPDAFDASSKTLSKLHSLIESVGGLKKWLPDTTKVAEELLAEVYSPKRQVLGSKGVVFHWLRICQFWRLSRSLRNIGQPFPKTEKAD